jgi:hypothetical protein
MPVSDKVDQKCQESLDRLKGVEIRRLYGNAAVDDARNRLVTNAIADGFDEILWIDSDIVFPVDAVAHIRSLKLPIVSGIYTKKGVAELSCALKPTTKKVVFGAGGSVFEVKYAPTGFLYTRAEVYEAVRAFHRLPVCNVPAHPVIPYFLPLVTGNEDGSWNYLSEDFSFCQRASDAGYKIMADSRIRLLHVGAYSYSWEDLDVRTKYSAYSVNIK